MDETGGRAPIALLHKAGRREKHAILVGPEGGFTEANAPVSTRGPRRPRDARRSASRAETALRGAPRWQNVGDGPTLGDKQRQSNRKHMAPIDGKS